MSLQAALVALAVALVGRTHVEQIKRYVGAITAVTDDTPTAAVMTTIAWRENWFHTASYPPFGVTDYVQTHTEYCRTNAECSRPACRRRGEERCTRLTIERAAEVSLHVLMYIANHRCVDRSWSAIIGSYRLGPTCCYPTEVSLIMVARIREHMDGLGFVR